MELCLRQVIGHIVRRPETVRVQARQMLQEDLSSLGLVKFEVWADDEDQGRLIGQKGVMARALRTVMDAASAKYGVRYELVLPSGSRRQESGA